MSEAYNERYPDIHHGVPRQRSFLPQVRFLLLIRTIALIPILFQILVGGLDSSSLLCILTFDFSSSTGHSGKHGHEFLEFEYSHGRLRYANNSNYRNDSLIRKESELATFRFATYHSVTL